MNKFGFVVHPIDANFFCDYYIVKRFISKILSPRFYPDIIKHMPPYKLCSINNIRSSGGSIIEADIVLIPLLPAHIAVIHEEKILNKIKRGISICEKNGAKIVGLGALTSVVGNEGEALSKKVGVPLTSGNTLTASLTLEGIYRAAYLMGLSLINSTIAIIGATGDIGSICTKILSKKVKKINIAARNGQKLQEFAQIIKHYGNAEVEVFKYTKDAICDVDIILTATSAITTLIDPMSLKPGAIVCDIAIPANIAKEVACLRDDIFVFEGGLAKFAYKEDAVNDKGINLLPGDSIYGCIAETATLTFENRFESFSIGRGSITEDKVAEICGMANKHGIKLSDFFCGYKFYTEKDIDSIRKSAERNKEKVYAARR